MPEKLTMYGVGAGAGEWRSPLNIPQVLSNSQIRVSVHTGNDPDQLRIRVVNSRGSSNQVTVTIVKVAPTLVASPPPEQNVCCPGVEVPEHYGINSQ